MEEFLRRQVIAPAYQQLPPEALILRALAGDTEAFVALICLKHGLVERICRQVLGTDHRVEDVIQEVFVQLWRQREGIHSPKALDRWLSRTARNLSLKVNQRERRDRGGRQQLSQAHEAKVGEQAGQPDRAAMQREMVNRVRAVLADQTEADQQVLLAAQHAEDDQAAADSLGVNVNAYRVRLHRARTRLRELFRKAGLAPVIGLGALLGSRASRAAVFVATQWSTTLGKAKLLAVGALVLAGVVFAGVSIGRWLDSRPAPSAAQPGPVSAVGPVESLQARNLRLTKDEIVGPLRDLLQQFYPPNNPLLIDNVQAMGSEVMVEFKTTRPPDNPILSARYRARYCLLRRRLDVRGQQYGNTKWSWMNPEKPFTISIPNPFGKPFALVRGREEFATAARLFDRLPSDERAGPDQARWLFGPPKGELLLPTGAMGITGSPGGLVVASPTDGLFLRDHAGNWTYAGGCQGWFPTVIGDRVYHGFEGHIRSRRLAEPNAPWEVVREEPRLRTGDQVEQWIATGGRLYLIAKGGIHLSRPLDNPKAEWVRTTNYHDFWRSWLTASNDTMFGFDGKQLLARPSAEPNAPWAPIGPWPDGCSAVVADGNRLLAFGGVGPIYARPANLDPAATWEIVGRVHDPYSQ